MELTVANFVKLSPSELETVSMLFAGQAVVSVDTKSLLRSGCINGSHEVTELGETLFEYHTGIALCKNNEIYIVYKRDSMSKTFVPYRFEADYDRALGYCVDKRNWRFEKLTRA